MSSPEDMLKHAAQPHGLQELEDGRQHFHRFWPGDHDRQVAYDRANRALPLSADGGAPVNLFTQGAIAGHAGPPQAGPAGAGPSLTLLQGQLMIAKALSVTVLLLPGTPESFQAGLNAREMAHIYHDSERDTNTDSGVSLTFSIESANGCAPRIRLTLELRRPEHALNSRSQQVPVHSGSIDLAFGHIFKKSNDESTTPNQIFNLKVDYAQEHSNAMISFDTTGATANNLKCLIDFPEGHDRVRNMPPATARKLYNFKTEEYQHVPNLRHFGNIADLSHSVAFGSGRKSFIEGLTAQTLNE
ncbi:hypothetical protein D6D23_05244 [Aureobasidium pullulans]|nr:hypothetical protein D6D23_05244 [Aureobasidium pullulans]